MGILIILFGMTLSINTTYKTSVAELNWWSFRALWALESAYPLLEKSNKALANRKCYWLQIKLLVNIKRDVPITDLKTKVVETIRSAKLVTSKICFRSISIINHRIIKKL